MRIGRACSFVVVSVLAGACHPIHHPDDNTGPGTTDSTDLATAAPVDGGTAGADMAAPLPAGTCATRFTYVPPVGRAIKSVQVTGEWNAFASPGVAMAPDGSGGFAVTVPLAPGFYGYKLLLDGSWELDPASGWRKYVGGVENSGVRVADCALPTLVLAGKSITRAARGQGKFHADLTWAAGSAGTLFGSIKAALRKDGKSMAVPVAIDDDAHPHPTIDLTGLDDGKYTILVDGKDAAGRAAKTLRLVFWVEAEAFDWRDAVIYMVMTDRFVNGDATNDAKPTANVDPRADYHGGDLQGVRARIADGTFDKLGVRALWISPFHRNPAGAWPADDGAHQVTGYHGYWPVKPREVDPRLGGADALGALVTEAHAHGIRVLEDFVVNHVHQEHDYFKAHPEWFRTGCVCGTNNCDWTAHRLDCLFAPYMPDVNWTLPEVNEQWSDDAVWWLDTFDIDGLRVDAVKHVEDAAVINLTSRIRGEFEAAGTRVFMTGETAMGWSDCGLACNGDNYGTISRYVGPRGLDGQADFVTYYAAPLQVFASDAHGMIHADYWTQQAVAQYPPGAIMTPYIGSQDTPRFVTLSSYRGQDMAHPPSVPGNKWTNIAAAPSDAEPYARHRLALAWLLTIPGAPMVYYGDEYGEWGGADPNNRVDWRGGGVLGAEEQATLARTQALGAARRELGALRRGTYASLRSTEDVLVFARQAGDDVALVALSRSPAPQTVSAPLPAPLGLADGTLLHDRLGGPDVTVAGQAVMVSLPPRGAAILAR